MNSRIPKNCYEILPMNSRIPREILGEILLKLPNPVKMCEKIINFSQIPLINP